MTNQKEPQDFLGPLMLNVMFKKAAELGAKGAGAVLFLTKSDLEKFLDNDFPPIDLDPSIRCNELTKKSSSRKGVVYNLIGGVVGKIVQSVRTLKPSGSKGSLTGELGIKGCLVFTWLDFYVFVAFSGGTTEEDIEIAQEGGYALLLDKA